jgi:hypothetical protein
LASFYLDKPFSYEDPNWIPKPRPKPMRRHQNVRPRYIRKSENELIDFKSDIFTVQAPRYFKTQQQTLVGQAKPLSSSTVNSGQIIVDKGDSTLVLEEGDLINFQDDVVHITKTRPSPAKAAQNDLIDFQSDIDWPAGQAPSVQVKRKMENPEYKMVTAHLVHTQKGAQILIKGMENPVLLDEDQKEFIRIQVKEALLREVAASKTWGKLPSVQTTFQLGTGN